MRSIVSILLMFAFVTAQAADPGLTTYGKAAPLLKWTDKLWAEREKSFSSGAGIYKQCGNYLFTFTPAGNADGKSEAMVGFALKKPDGGIAQVFVSPSKDIRLWEGPPGAQIFAKYFYVGSKDHPTKKSYVIVLSKEEYAQAGACIGIKKWDPAKVVPKKPVPGTSA